MKKIIVLCLFLFPFIKSQCQSWVIPTDGYKPAKDSAIRFYDTSRCIMLCADTGYVSVVDGISPFKRPIDVFCLFGYDISKFEWVDADEINEVPGHIEISRICYLDDKKRPLNKNIVVWDSKEIK